MFHTLQLGVELGGTMIEYITAITLIALIGVVVALITERREVIKLRNQLMRLELRYRQLGTRLNEYANELIMTGLTKEGLSTNEEDLDTKILKLYERGYSYGRIARELGISKSTVYRRLKKLRENKRKEKEVEALYYSI